MFEEHGPFEPSGYAIGLKYQIVLHSSSYNQVGSYSPPFGPEINSRVSYAGGLEFNSQASQI